MLQLQAIGLLHIIDQHDQSSNSSPLLEMGSLAAAIKSSSGSESSYDFTAVTNYIRTMLGFSGLISIMQVQITLNNT
jgi:hypothetical protein